MTTVSVTIANWNSSELIERCIDSLLAQTHKDIEIILVDDASSDGSADLVEQKYPSVKVFRNTKNSGFCKTQNRGIRESQGDFVLPLNQDAFLMPNFIEEMLMAMAKDPQIGTVSGKLLSTKTKEGRPVIDSAGHQISAQRIPTNRGAGIIDTGQFDKEEYIFGARGAAPLYRRAMIEDIMIDNQLFDESFVAYLDDVDVDWRAQMAGWKCYYMPSAVAHHVSGTSRERNKLRRLMEMHETKNRYLLMLKNDLKINVLKKLPYILAFEIDRLITILLFRWRFFRSYWEFFKLVPSTLQKRRFIMAKKRVSDEYMNKWFR